VWSSYRADGGKVGISDPLNVKGEGTFGGGQGLQNHQEKEAISASLGSTASELKLWREKKIYARGRELLGRP